MTRCSLIPPRTHFVEPRTPFLFQAGSSAEGIDFATTHAEANFVSSPSPELLRVQIEKNRKAAADKGRDPCSLKVCLSFTPILGKSDEEAQEKFPELNNKTDSDEARKLCGILKPTPETPVWTPRLIGEKAAMSDISPSAVWSPATVADVMEGWVEVAELDGINLGYITSPALFKMS
ncbi:hypothetical protein Daus18300_005451 [Diaporthe australafricana]|uniref:Luciferase-like domain-containing protein n=1 Tax=Diaporthe australafricana TaxID=127596 RepID=A0ABR3X113_9PEZI